MPEFSLAALRDWFSGQQPQPAVPDGMNIRDLWRSVPIPGQEAPRPRVIIPTEPDRPAAPVESYDPMTGAMIGAQEGRGRPNWFMEPDLQGYQTGRVELPPGAVQNEAGGAYYPDTGESLSMVRRPNVIPIASTPEGYTLAMPKLADLASYIMGGSVPLQGGEVAFGAGAVRRGGKPPPPPTELPDLGGLSFPAEEAADRLRLKLAREAKAATTGEPLPGGPSNPRTVLEAPMGPPQEKHSPTGAPLPDYVTGNVTFDDWIKRHEYLMSPQQIQGAATWYQEIYGNFLRQANGDEAKAKQYMRAWLVAQQNVDVTGAMGNALLQREQILRGVPEEQMVGAGMPNPTIAARRVMQERPIEGGVGQKISDFVDAAEGKQVRSWMGNDPQGGSPFVVDVHTARDTGMVDQELINHLKRMGYPEMSLSKLKADLGTSPSATQYENRAKFGRELTDHLNDIKWQGRSDWTPEQVQAVGWMGMTRLTANKADDVATGLQGQMRHLSMELSPGEGSPWATKYGERFSALPADRQYELTHQMTQSAIDRASKIAGVDIRDIVHATGGWQHFQNPSTVAQAFASKGGAEIAANALGYLLQQTEVWSNKIKPRTANPKGFAVDFIADGKHTFDTDAGLRDFWAKITAADPTGHFQGYQPIRTPDGRIGIRALVDRGGAKTAKDLESAVENQIRKVVEGMSGEGGIDFKFHEAEITKARNDWTKDKGGEVYKQRLVDLLGRDPTADLGRHGSELEKEFAKALDAIERKRAAAAIPEGAALAKLGKK